MPRYVSQSSLSPLLGVSSRRIAQIMRDDPTFPRPYIASVVVCEGELRLASSLEATGRVRKRRFWAAAEVMAWLRARPPGSALSNPQGGLYASARAERLRRRAARDAERWASAIDVTRDDASWPRSEEIALRLKHLT